MLSIGGGVMDAQLSLSAGTRRHAFVLLVLVITAELVELAWPHIFRTA